MEQQTTTASTPSPTISVEAPSAQTPPTRPQTPLSISEPFLRFPRPQGNRRLASWISASDPDIMYSIAVPPENTSLTESTFELVAGTDGESQDGNYTESMADSVGSLDPHRPDDVHSLDGTEYTNDYESVVDDLDFPPLISQLEHDGENEALLVTHKRNSELSDVVDGEVCSPSSLVYTHHSLGTPSISTPEASRLTERPLSPRLAGPIPQQSPVNCQGSSKRKPARFCKVGALVKDHAVNMARTTLPGLLFATALFLLVAVLYKGPAEQGKPQFLPVASTITHTYAVVSVTKTSSQTRTRPTSTGGMGLIPLDSQKSDEWLFGTRKPVVSFNPRAPSGILVHVADDVKQSWLQKGCLKVTALREDRRVETTLSPVGQDLLLKFPRKEAYGVVRLALEATCRPKMQRMFNVQFGKGVMEEVMEMTRSLAHDLTGLVPAAAQEAERCLAGTKRSLCAVSDRIGNSVIFVSDDLVNRVIGAVATAHHSANAAKSGVAMLMMRDTTEGIVKKLDATTQQVTKQLLQVQRIQTRMQLTLLNAQLSAKIWWLEATGRKAEHDDYQRKAKDLMTKKRAAAKEALQAGWHQDKEAEKPSRQWLRMRRRCRGQESPRRGSSSTQEVCRAVVA